MNNFFRLFLLSLVMILALPLPSVFATDMLPYGISQDPLIIRLARTEISFENGTKQLKVEGEVHNITKVPQPIPDILATAVGADNKAMKNWRIVVSKATLRPDGTEPFRSTADAPQGIVSQIRLQFVDASKAQQ